MRKKQLVLIKCKTKAPEFSLPADLLINSNLMQTILASKLTLIQLKTTELGKQPGWVGRLVIKYIFSLLVCGYWPSLIGSTANKESRIKADAVRYLFIFLLTTR